MSYMIVRCAWCGTQYHFGVVGTQMIGGHTCNKRVDCTVPGCGNSGSFLADAPGSKSHSGVFRCGDHLEGCTILGAQPGGSAAKRAARSPKTTSCLGSLREERTVRREP